MFGKHETDVLVVGAGPVGLLTALLLNERGVRVQIIDEQWRGAAHSYACALHPGSQALLQSLGLMNHVLADGLHLNTVGFYDAVKRRAAIKYADLGVDYPFLAVLRQDQLERILAERLEQRGVRIGWNQRLAVLEPENGHVTATVDHLAKVTAGYATARTEWTVDRVTTTRAKFVVGADGIYSTVRRLMELELETLGPAQVFAVFEFRSDAERGHELAVVFADHTVNVMWPLPDRHCRWSFQIHDDRAARTPREKSRLAVHIGSLAFPFVAAEDLTQMLRARAPWFAGSVEEMIWSMAVRFERRMARRFGQGRVWLAGDAGHATGPAGIQSMNVGFQEAYDLTQRIAATLRDKASLDTFEAYNEERVREWRKLLGATGGLTAAAQADPWIAERSAAILPCLPACGADLDHLAHQLNLSFAETAEVGSTA